MFGYIVIIDWCGRGFTKGFMSLRGIYGISAYWVGLSVDV